MTDETCDLLVAVLHPNTKGQRKGQAMFNTLANLNRAVADKIHGTKFDPFYDDKRIPAFVIRLSELLRP